MSTSPLNRRRTASARRPLSAVLTAAFILLQQVAFIFPTAATAQTTRRQGVNAPAAGRGAPALGSSTKGSAPVALAVSTTLVINEIDYDQVGTDNAEYLELKNVSGAPINLDNYTVELVNAGATGGPAVYDTINLPNVNLAAGDYYVICSNAATVVNCDLDDDPNTDFIQNGNPDAVALRLSGALVDVVSYEGNTTGFTETAGTPNNATGADSNTVANVGLSRLPDGSDTDNNSTDLTIRCITPGSANVSANTSCPAPTAIPNLTINDVTANEGNAGTTTFTFTVSLSSPAGPGGVTFDIATADGTAQDDVPDSEDNDYVARALTGQTIPAGSSTFTFDVTVNGDATPETTENFFVNVTNVTGAAVTDGQGQGTITNDDSPNLSISDVSQEEGNGGGTTAFTFTVSLSTTTHGGVTFDICTADGTAQDDVPDTEDNDYAANCLTGQTIAGGSDSYQFTVNVNADSTAEPNETFFVNITNVVGANATDGQGQGTIVNDDFVITPIHDIQGSGDASPLAGQTVTTTGIVTLLRTSQNSGAGSTASGFFLQTPDADSDPNTSEGIFVFTSSVPTVSVADEVRVTGTVVEFNGLTEITSVTSVTVIDTGNTLPTAVTLDSTILSPTAAPTQPQLEKYEGMRLAAAALRTVAPNDNFYDVDTVLATVPRPVREPGIPVSDPVPPDPTTGTPDCCIPIWDENPERLKVDTNGRAGAANNAYTSNVTFTAPAGPLDYAFGQYRLVLDAAPAASPNMTAVPVRTPNADEYTVASYNIENFNNNATQREKAALTVRTILHYPDIIGAVEIFDLADLQALRDEINNDAVAAGDPNPQYEAYLVEADGTSEDNDQDVGFLVKTSRVQVNSVTQEREEETFINPVNGQPETLHDRPPFVLDATVDPSGANPRRVLVVVNHLRSFIDIELVTGEGARVREKRKRQAESLADLLNDLQTGNPGVPVISVGDYNAYEFNSGYDDSVSVIKGTPTEDDEIVVDQSPDLVDPNFFNLIETLPANDRYSFIFEGTPQSLDHHIVNTTARSRNTGIAVARVNSDFPENPPAVYASNAATPERNSDHDPVVSYYTLSQGQSAGTLIISEFRFHGPSQGEEVAVDGDGGAAAAPGTPAENDEYIEFYNNTDADITVSTLDGSPGWALAASDGAVRFIIPNGTVIPARHHFLAVNTDGYSLFDYAIPDSVLLPDGETPAGGYNVEIPNESGIALFRTANSLFLTAENRLDAVGYNSVPELYREGAGLVPGPEAGAAELEYAWVRKVCIFGDGAACPNIGLPKDTGENAADFVSVDTGGFTQSLGAPGPEGLSSPFQRNADFPATLLDPASPQSSPPNRVRDMNDTTGPNKTFGTMSLRRTLTNNTGSTVDYLSFRVIAITTFPSVPGRADLRVLDSEDIVVTVNGSPVDVRGTYVETPPAQPNGGALNSSIGVGFINLEENSIEPGAAISVQFLLGVKNPGSFRFYVNVEAFGDCGECPAPESPAAAKWLKEQRAAKAKARAKVQGAPRPRARGGKQ